MRREDPVNAAFTDKVRRGIFNPIARYLTGFCDAEDRLQDAIAQTWWFYRRRRLERGIDVPDALLVHACAMKARGSSHRFVPGERKRRANDVLDLRAAMRGVRLTDIAVHETGVSYEYDHNSMLDLAALVPELDELDQAILSGNLMDATTTELARELCMSISGVHRRERLLGERVAKRAGIPVYRKPRAPRYAHG